MHRLVTAGVLLLLVATIPVAAHGNYLESDTQTTADGTVTIEVLTAVTDGFVVLHEANGNEIGPVVGYTDPGEGPVHTDLTVQIDESYWQNVTNHTTLFAVLHRNEGDEEFDPDTDPMQASASGDLVATRFMVGKTDENRSLVLAETDHAQEVNSSQVTVRSVSLASDGHLVIRANADGAPGDVVGQTALSAGTHRDVTVAIDEHFYSHRDERFSVWAVLHCGDGDGQFDPDGDRPQTVDGARIQTQLDLHRTGDIEAHDHGTPSPTATPTSGNETHDQDHSHTETTTPAPTPTYSPTPAPAPDPTDPPTTQASTGQAPGFTLLGGLVALLTFGLLARRGR